VGRPEISNLERQQRTGAEGDAGVPRAPRIGEIADLLVVDEIPGEQHHQDVARGSGSIEMATKLQSADRGTGKDPVGNPRGTRPAVEKTFTEGPLAPRFVKTAFRSAQYDKPRVAPLQPSLKPGASRGG
jgi:hypothetical protein